MGYPQPPPPAAPRHRPLGRLASQLALLALMWLIRVLDSVLPGSFNGLAQHAWNPATLLGIFASPLLHSSWAHLIANTVPFLILGCLVAAQGTARFWYVTLVATVSAGLGAFVLALPGTVTVGASGLVFGYFGYLLASAVSAAGWAQRLLQGGVALLVAAVFGASMLTGLIPRADGISWQAHLCGAAGGVLAAWWIRHRRGPRRQGPADLDWSEHGARGRLG